MIENYTRPKGDIPNRHKSAKQVEADEKMSRDVEEFLKSNEVEHVSGVVKTVAEVLDGNRIKANLNKTISHKYGSMKLNR